MSYEPSQRTTFGLVEHIRRHAIDELDVVTLAADVHTADGETIPAGTPGTVVAVWGDMDEFDVEFDEPFSGLVTVGRALIGQHRRTG